MAEKIAMLQREINKAIIGKEEIVSKVLIVLIAGGHILLNDIPGVGKTTLALAISKSMSLKFNRIQFTPDVVPSDITGFTVFNKETGAFDYKEGAAMCNILLADEINRTSSKTQSALLEVMQEGKITVDGVTHKVPEPFTVIATQNPIGTAGTQMLPEAQLDRFMVQLSIGYPDRDAQIDILKGRKTSDPLDSLEPVVTGRELLEMRKAARDVYVDGKIYEYVTDLCQATREHQLIRLGVSPRGALALCSMAQAWAFTHERDYVIPADVQSVFGDVCRHRIIASPKAQMESLSADEILRGILESAAVPDVTRQNK